MILLLLEIDKSFLIVLLVLTLVVSELSIHSCNSAGFKILTLD